MQIVFSTVEEMFDELQSRKVKEVRMETVTTTMKQSVSGIVVSHFDLYITAKAEEDVMVVVIPFYQSIEGLIKQQKRKIEANENKLVSEVERLARIYDIQLLSGAYWPETPFKGVVNVGGINEAIDDNHNRGSNTGYL